MKMATLSLAVAFLLVGCSFSVRRPPVGSEAVVTASHEMRPEWTTRRRESADYYYYVGLASDVPSLAQGFDLAYLNALLQLTRSVGMAWTVDEQEARATNLDTLLRQSLKGVPVATVARGAEVEERYYTKKERVTEKMTRCRGYYGPAHCPVREVEVRYDVWVLVRYPKVEWEQYQHAMHRAVH